MITVITVLLMSVSLLAGCGGNKSSVGGDKPDKIAQCPAYGRMDRTKEKKEEREKASAPFSDMTSFTAVTLDGKEFTEKDFAGYDLTVINIWSTTCPPCIDEMPALAAFANSLPDNISLITWCLDGAQERETAEKVISGSGMKKATIAEGDGDLQTVYRQLMYTPTTLIVDCEGHVIGDPIIGSSDNLEEVYTEAINCALETLGKDRI